MADKPPAKASGDESAGGAAAPQARVGVLGGTFDPVHLGHLRAAEEFAALAGLDRVLLVPCAIPPHRDQPPVASPGDRLEMIGLAVRGNPRLAACDHEVRRGGTSFTVDTLRELARARPGGSLALAMGSDAFREFGLWRDPEGIAALADLWVLARPGSPVPDLLSPLPPSLRKAYRREGEVLRHPAGTVLRSAAVTALDISSSGIRASAAAGRTIRYLVPDPVRSFIEERGLYRAGAKEETKGGTG